MIAIGLRPITDLPGQNTREPVELNGTVLSIGTTEYDLSELPDGATAEHTVLGKVTRNGDDYECSILLMHGPNAPEETRFPQPIILPNDHSGPVELPPYGAPEVTE